MLLLLAVTNKVGEERPMNDRHEYLLGLANEHVHPVEAGGHWKGPVTATVPSALARDVGEAMTNQGSLVDVVTHKGDGTVTLTSKGYWAHGF